MLDLGFDNFLDAARKANLGVVIIGGLMGGLLQPTVAKLNPRRADPPNSRFLLSPLLGLAAAGISIYAVANSKTDDSIHLMFFALLCGLAFPAVLSSAVDSVSRHSAEVQGKIRSIAADASADGIDTTRQAAQALTTTLAQNPPDSVNSADKPGVEAAAQQAISNIAQTATTDPENVTAVIEELRDVGTVAKTVGWQSTATAALDQLRKLGSAASDPEVRKLVQSVITRLSE